MNILEYRYYILAVFMVTVAWLDFKTRQISVWIYAAFGCLLLAGQVWLGQILYGGMLDRFFSMGIGMAMLGVSKVTGGAVGEGDGWFFIISGIVLNFWSNMALFCYGLLFCSLFCMGLLVWGALLGTNVKKIAVPFLPFILPAGLVVMWL